MKRSQLLLLGAAGVGAFWLLNRRPDGVGPNPNFPGVPYDPAVIAAAQRSGIAPPGFHFRGQDPRDGPGNPGDLFRNY